MCVSDRLTKTEKQAMISKSTAHKNNSLMIKMMAIKCMI